MNGITVNVSKYSIMLLFLSSRNVIISRRESEARSGRCENLALLTRLLCFLVFCSISERIDNEMAQEIQEQLVWQAEQQRKQEEKDEVRLTLCLCWPLVWH